MTRTAVLICPGRGTYNKPELGYIARHHGDKAEMLAEFDAIRAETGQEAVTALDAATRFSTALHTRGDIASPLIYAASLGDALAVDPGIEIVAVTGNSMGWYTALAAAGALTPEHGFRLVNTMGTLMQESLIGGQLIYPFVGEDWRDDPARKAELLQIVTEIDARADHTLALSIDLGGMLVLAGDAAGLSAFETAVPAVQDRFPMRLPNHAGFHTALQAPVADRGRAVLPSAMFGQPDRPLIDGRGEIWWPHATNTRALWDYTLGHQVTETYEFTHAIRVAAEAFAPDLFIVTGPGTTLGGAVAQSLILAGWAGMRSKSDFQTRQGEEPLLISMGMAEQRPLATDTMTEAKRP